MTGGAVFTTPLGNQIQEANDIILGAGYSKDEQAIANRRHQDARRQKQKLEQTSSTSTNNDFYIYRYLASQGFLPGYNFPALPLLAWLPAPNGQTEEDTVLARARFLGLSEFGPRNLIYHRGRIYRIDRLKINGVGRNDDGRSSVADESGRGLSELRLCARFGRRQDFQHV